VTRHRLTYFLLLSLLAISVPVGAQSEADLPRFSDTIQVIGDIPFIEPVDSGQPVSIRFGIGELEIESTSSNEIRADLRVECREKLSEALCEKYRNRLRLEPRETDEGVEVRLVGLPKYKMRKLRLDGRVQVPRWSPLTVKVGIGDVDIYSDAKDLLVEMGIGDLTVRVPSDSVGTVQVATRIGDATVSVSDGPSIHTKRRMLVGARVNWTDGEGDATISVGLKIGDAKVVLE
jgi:hypothetical protein